MPGFDPANDPRVKQAVNADRAMRGLPPLPDVVAPASVAAPMSSPEAPMASNIDQLAAQDAQLAAQQQADLGMAGLGVQSLPPEQVMSVQPPTQPAEENVVDRVSEPLASYPEDGPAAPPGANSQQSQLSEKDLRTLFTQYGGGARRTGMANPLPGMQAEAGRNAAAYGGQSRAYEAQGDEAVASAQQAAADIGQSRSDTAGNVAGVQERTAQEGQQYVAQLADLEDSRNKALQRVQSEEREITDMISNYQPKDRRGWGQKITGALAVALGGLTDQANLAAGLNAGVGIQTDNAGRAMALINRAIDRDLEQQRMMLDNKKTALAAKGTELGQIRERFGDSVDNLKLGRAMKLDQAAQEIEAAKSRGMQGEQIAVADQTIAQLQIERANLLMGINEEKANRYLAQEQQIKLQRYAQQQAARPRAMTPQQAAELEGKQLDNAKKRQELEGGPGDKKLTEGQAKLKRDLLGAKDDIRAVAGALDTGVPYLGMRGAGSSMPDLLTPTDNLKLRNAILSAHDVAMRDKSGAAIGKEERAADLDALGVFSSDPEVAAAGIKKLQRRIIERAKEVGVDPAEIGVVDQDVRDLTRPLSQ